MCSAGNEGRQPYIKWRGDADGCGSWVSNGRALGPAPSREGVQPGCDV
jgi:hypothetical protein